MKALSSTLVLKFLVLPQKMTVWIGVTFQSWTIDKSMCKVPKSGLSHLGPTYFHWNDYEKLKQIPWIPNAEINLVIVFAHYIILHTYYTISYTHQKLFSIINSMFFLYPNLTRFFRTPLSRCAPLSARER